MYIYIGIDVFAFVKPVDALVMGRCQNEQFLSWDDFQFKPSWSVKIRLCLVSASVRTIIQLVLCGTDSFAVFLKKHSIDRNHHEHWKKRRFFLLYYTASFMIQHQPKMMICSQGAVEQLEQRILEVIPSCIDCVCLFFLLLPHPPLSTLFLLYTRLQVNELR